MEFNTNIFLEMHRLVTKHVLNNNLESGAFRTKQVYVGRRIFEGTGFREVVDYMPPDTKDVPLLVEEFVEWLNKKETWEINPVLLAGITHYEVARIHPFIDGNGRTARLLATWVLYISGFDHRRFFALDDYYDSDRQAYYSALKTVDKEKRDLPQWLEYFTEGVLYSVNSVKESVEKIGITSLSKSQHPQIALTPRQTQVVELIAKNGKATNRDFQAIFKISAQAVHKELNKLVAMNVITTQGKGRSIIYIMVDD